MTYIELLIETAKKALQVLTDKTPLQKQKEFLEFVIKDREQDFNVVDFQEQQEKGISFPPMPIAVFTDLAKLGNEYKEGDLKNKYGNYTIVLTQGTDFGECVTINEDFERFCGLLITDAAKWELGAINRQMKLEQAENDRSEYFEKLQSFTTETPQPTTDEPQDNEPTNHTTNELIRIITAKTDNKNLKTAFISMIKDGMFVMKNNEPKCVHRWYLYQFAQKAQMYGVKIEDIGKMFNDSNLSSAHEPKREKPEVRRQRERHIQDAFDKNLTK